MRGRGPEIRARTAFACLLGFGWAAVRVPREARAQASENTTIAEALFRDAQARMQAGQIHEACEKFAASQAAEPALGTLLNLAVCHEKEGKSATAWTEFALVGSQAARAGDAARETYAKNHAAALEPTLHRVVFEVPEPVESLALKLDSQPLVAPAWGTPVPLDPGEHRIEAAAPGFLPWTQVMQLAPGGGIETVRVPRLEPAPLPPELARGAPSGATTGASATNVASANGATAAPAGDDSSLSQRTTLGIALGGAGLLALGAGVYLGARALSYASDRDSICAPGERCSDERAYQRALDAHQSAKEFQTLGLVADGVGIVALGTAAWLVLIPHPATSSVRVVPSAGAGRAGAAFVGAF